MDKDMKSTIKECLEQIEVSNGPKFRKYSNYIDEYGARFDRFRGTKVAILEVGVQHGGSLHLWRSYFGPDAQIFGVDIIPECKRFEVPGTKILIGDQSDPEFLRSLSEQLPALDIIIDDASHVPWHQIATFEALFYDKLNDGGLYIVEDCHTSYMRSYGGGLRKRGSFIEYAKNLVDEINAWNAEHPKLHPSKAAKSIRSIVFGSSIVIFEKAHVDMPKPLQVGVETIDLQNPFAQVGSAGSDRTMFTSVRNAALSRLKSMPWVRNRVRRSKLLWLLARRVMRS